MVYEWRDAVVLITGAAKGIGSEVVRLALEEGAKMDEYYLRTNVRVLTICFGATDTGLIALQNMGNFDDVIASKMGEPLKVYPSQKVESAAQSVIDMYKVGASATTWLSNADKPVQDITDYVKKGFSIMSEPIFN